MEKPQKESVEWTINDVTFKIDDLREQSSPVEDYFDAKQLAGLLKYKSAPQPQYLDDVDYDEPVIVACDSGELTAVIEGAYTVYKAIDEEKPIKVRYLETGLNGNLQQLFKKPKVDVEAVAE